MSTIWFRPLVSIVAVLALCAAKEPPVTPPLDQESGKFVYQDVIQVDGVSAAELQSRARAWLAQAYRSAQDVIQLDDASAMRIIAKGAFSVPWLTDIGTARHTLTLEFKDGRYRYTLTDFMFKGSQWTDFYPLEDKKHIGISRRKILGVVVLESESLIADLKSAMEQGSPVGDDEW